MRKKSENALLQNLRPGRVYCREKLKYFSKAVDRDVKNLTEKAALVKVGPGLYYKPKVSRFGFLPPNETDLVREFLGEDNFLLFTWNDYNTMGLGLTQLHNSYVVYNYKRHEKINLDGKLFYFRRPARGFPSKLSREYLLVDLVNNISHLGEEVAVLESRIMQEFFNFNTSSVLKLAKKYGKIKTQKFFEELCKKE